MRNIATAQGVKRTGSPTADASGTGAKKRSRKPVKIPEDIWLDALKHLSCTNWSKMRLVSHQLNGLVGRNVSRLPLGIVESSTMTLRYIYSTTQKKTEAKMIVSESNISPNEQEQWFTDRCITIDIPGDIQLNNAIIGMDLKENYCVDLWILGPPQSEEHTPDERARARFFDHNFEAEFSPHRNKYSWATMAFFLKLLYDPSTYVKELSMYGLDKKLKEILFPDEEERYIRCGTFTLQVPPGTSVTNLCKSVLWLEQNIQANMIQFYNDIKYTENVHYYDDEICEAVSNYLLGSSWTSANQMVELGRVGHLGRFIEILVEKFPTIAVQSIFPIIVLSGRRTFCCDSLNNRLSGKSIVKEKLEDPEDDSDDSDELESDDESDYSEGDGYGTYTISNGSNRMRIEFVR